MKMNQNAQPDFTLIKNAKRKRLLVTTSLTVLVLASITFGLVNLASNHARKAHAASSCTPQLTSVSAFAAGQSPNVTIQGTCLGMNSPISSADTPYFRITIHPSTLAEWHACYTGDPGTDSVTCNISSWTDTSITFGGFTGAYGQNGWVVNQGDALLIQVWNSQTGPSVCPVTAGATGITQCTPTPTPTPTLTKPSLPEYIQASDAAYGLSDAAYGLGNFNAPAGMTTLVRSDYINSSWRSDGFEAVVLQDSQDNIIIANEGTVPGITKPYYRNSVLADIEINDDHTPKALTDAINFAGTVLSDYYGKPGYGQIYVTGHSLGGIEAQAEAKAWGNIAGGATFGATGLPGNTTAGGTPTLINYVEYGDPVGNYASDSVNALSEKTLGLMYHYGPVKMIGSPLDATQLTKAVIRRDALLDLPPATPVSVSGIFHAYAADYLSLSAFTNEALGLKDHLLGQYAKDIISATIPPLSTVSLDALLLMYDLQLGNIGFSYLKATTVQANGMLTSPDVSLSENANTSQITLDDLSSEKLSVGTLDTGIATFYLDPLTREIVGEKFVASDGVVYLVALNSAENPTTIAVTLKTGGSYRISYDTLNQQAWNNVIQFYTGKNEMGMITETIYNWRVGGSQVQLFTGLPRGVHEELKNYSGPNGTGKLLSTQFK